MTDTLPAGTLWIPMAQPQKHWIQAVLGEEPFVPFPYFYDVATWSYSLLRGLAGNGVLTKQHAVGRGDDARQRSRRRRRSRAPRARCTRSTATRCRRSASPCDLMNAGATVYRAKDAFDFDGRHYDTGVGARRRGHDHRRRPRAAGAGA